MTKIVLKEIQWSEPSYVNGVRRFLPLLPQDYMIAPNKDGTWSWFYYGTWRHDCANEQAAKEAVCEHLLSEIMRFVEV